MAHGKRSSLPAQPLLKYVLACFLCRTAGHDRCFVTSRGGLCLCTREGCTISRSVHLNSDMALQYECEHVRVYQPRLSSYRCSESIRDKLRKVVASLPGDTPPVVQVSEQL